MELLIIYVNFYTQKTFFQPWLAAILKIAAILKTKQVANGLYQTNTLRGVPMPTFMLVPQIERFCLNSDLICRAKYCVVHYI